MTRWLARIGLLLLAGVLGFAYLFFRPGQDFSPYRMNRIFHPDERVANFREMRRIFPSRELKPSAVPRAWPEAPRPIPQQYLFKGESRALKSFIERTSTTSIVVIRDGRLQSEQYEQGASADSRFTSWSVAKSFVATLIGIALHEGRIQSLEDPVSRYVPSYAGKPYGDSSLRSLLRMASGIRFDETYSDKFSDINKLFYKVFIFGQSIDDAVAEYPREARPEQFFKYVSSDTQVLSQVVRAVFGMPLAEAVQRKLWDPLGAQSGAFWSLDEADGRELGYCCLNATARDFARLGQLHLNDGVWNGQRLLPEGWVKSVTRPAFPWQEPDAPNPGNIAGRNGPRGYGMHFWVPRGYDGEFMAFGIWGQTIWVSEKDRVVVVRTAVDKDYRDHHEELFEVMRTIAKG